MTCWLGGLSAYAKCRQTSNKENKAKSNRKLNRKGKRKKNPLRKESNSSEYLPKNYFKSKVGLRKPLSNVSNINNDNGYSQVVICIYSHILKEYINKY